MKDVSTLLSVEELEHLDQFLLGRIDDDDTHGKDEGVLDVSELDGLFTAIVSGPVIVMPSQWLPVVWSDFEPVWESDKEFEDIFSLMIRHMNAISATLVEHPQDFEPLFLERDVKGKIHTVVDEWCRGYMRGVGLAMEQWSEGGQMMKILLTPIMTFASEQGWQALDKMSDTEIENIQNAIEPNVREIHAWWLSRRQQDTTATPVRRATPRVGRNEPCPCGSGKKFKHCCLH